MLGILNRRESPSMQGNSILALSGLAVYMANVNRLVDDKSKPLQYVTTKDWLTKVADTVMVVFDGNFKPKGNPFQWCQQVWHIALSLLLLYFPHLIVDQWALFFFYLRYWIDIWILLVVYSKEPLITCAPRLGLKKKVYLGNYFCYPTLCNINVLPNLYIMKK